MGKVNKKLKQLDKLADEKSKLRKREQMLQELKSFSLDNATAGLLKSIVTSNGKSKQKKKDTVKPR